MYKFSCISVTVEDATPVAKKEEAPKPAPLRVGDAERPFTGL